MEMSWINVVVTVASVCLSILCWVVVWLIIRVSKLEEAMAAILHAAIEAAKKAEERNGSERQE